MRGKLLSRRENLEEMARKKGEIGDLGREEKKKRSGHIGMKEVGDVRCVSESQPIPLCSLKNPRGQT